ncbi:uncharacterized protein BT62DRAFT_935532 [Guyanagaster necrorhizus]|uniref:F-box domain-containing protein n=1 Tax=Guyanagaster necrorhizus TaxID=856835 RepID=A0A9P8APB4_9AGAR|nr:uncharacterized protein BT62DRAFT_935532 [Guyanagaster necrorhizus MCA 3950]KAG7442804.1 hypothetical protein BT62DRAFT_935532 [Guyanagaster necrorhizus MCA 3950]
MASFIVPMELVDSMFDELNTPADLFSCSLVCRNWHAFAQARLFSRIQLDSNFGKPPVNTVHKFHHLLSASPHVASHVREVTVCVRAHDSDDKLPWILSRLSNLKSLKIQGSGRVVWENLPQGVRATLETAMTRVARLQLSLLIFSGDMQNIFSLFAKSTVLTDLALFQIFPRTPAPVDVNGPVTQGIRLRSLSLTLKPEVLTYTLHILGTTMDVSELRHLAVHTYSWWDNKALQEFLKIPTLQSLSFAPASPLAYNNPVTFPRVRRISLTTCVLSELPWALSSVVAWWTELFSQSEMRMLEEVNLELVAKSLLDLGDKMWVNLDAALARLPVKKVVVTAKHPRVSAKAIEHSFPQLRRAGVLDVSERIDLAILSASIL